jgi:hypothetical protein
MIRVWSPYIVISSLFVMMFGLSVSYFQFAAANLVFVAITHPGDVMEVCCLCNCALNSRVFM